MCNDPVYMLFAGDWYYPCGGMGDFQGNFQTIADAITWAKARFEWWHVVDKSSMKIVAED